MGCRKSGFNMVDRCRAGRAAGCRFAAVIALVIGIWTGLGLRVEFPRSGGIAVENLSNRAVAERTLVVKGVDMRGREIWLRRVFIRHLGGGEAMELPNFQVPEAWSYRFGEE